MHMKRARGCIYRHRLWRPFALLAAVASLCSCASDTGTPEPRLSEYHSPIGGFSCSDSQRGMAVEEQLGPVAGTIYIERNGYRTRIDVHGMNPDDLEILDDDTSTADIHDAYLVGVLLPLIRSGVPDSEIIDRVHRAVDGRPILFSAVLMPSSGAYTGPDGKRRDLVRCQAQFMNSRSIYTVSANHTVHDRTEWDDEKILSCYDSLYEQLSVCDFPR